MVEWFTGSLDSHTRKAIGLMVYWFNGFPYGENHWFSGLMVYWLNGLLVSWLLVEWFNGFPYGENQAPYRIVGTKATEYRVGDTLPPIFILTQGPTIWVPGLLGYVETEIPNYLRLARLLDSSWMLDLLLEGPGD